MKLYSDAARDGDVAGMGWNLLLSYKSFEGKRAISSDCTSMEAEYFALLDGLRMARKHGDGDIEVYTDCKPLIEKMSSPNGDNIWEKRREGCLRLLEKFDSWTLEWTPRGSNAIADDLAYEALESGRQS